MYDTIIFCDALTSFRKIIFEKQWFFLDNAVGELYGTTFEVESGGTLKPHIAKQVVSTAGEIILCIFDTILITYNSLTLLHIALYIG